jgi:hypothetical protein
MKKIFNCRRTVVCILVIVVLFVLGYEKSVDVAYHIVTVAGMLIAGNVTEKIKAPKIEDVAKS